ncbi:hypothetical protein CYMTET_52741 [Cymbomonas tetramitiformis]|uniref:Uncharacterized protein n=1 Tax=Cymbomonas tetramitiformis TaxID=36881 RepID=A0AAE0BIE5_9CHLO|nr:hypothetical protein CYMTET_52741 [Cymbomonas tetramitiformis]
MQTEGTTREESSTSQRPHYTGSKEDDREEFCLVFSRPVTDENDDGEVSDEYLRDGNSSTGLTGCDGKESTMYYWAFRKFVHELNKRFLMRGTKEKNAMLKAVPQTEQQDGVTFVRSCEKRSRLLSTTKDTVTGDMRRSEA